MGESAELSFPLDVKGAGAPCLRNSPRDLEAFSGEQIQRIEDEEQKREGVTRSWGAGPTGAQKQVRGNLNLALLAEPSFRQDSLSWGTRRNRECTR